MNWQETKVFGMPALGAEPIDSDFWPNRWVIVRDCAACPDSGYHKPILFDALGESNWLLKKGSDATLKMQAEEIIKSL